MKKLLLLSTIIFSSTTFTINEPEKNQLHSAYAQEIIKGIPFQAPEQLFTPCAGWNQQNGWGGLKTFIVKTCEDTYKGTLLPIPHLNQRAKMERALSYNKPTQRSNNLIEPSFITTMNLISRQTDPCHDHLMHKLITKNNHQSYVKTTFGYKRYAHLLCSPTTNTEELIKRQHIIKQLINNQQLFNHCAQLLDTFKTHEDYFLNLYDQQKMIAGPLHDSLYFFGNSTKGTTLNRIAQYAYKAHSIYLIPLGISIPSTIMYFKHAKQYSLSDYLQYIKTIISNAHKSLIAQHGKLLVNINGILYGIINILAAIDLSSYAQAEKSIQSFTMHLANGMKNTQALYDICEKELDLETVPSSIATLNINATTVEPIKELKTLFDTNTFNGSPSVLSRMERALYTYKKADAEAFKKAYMIVLDALGELDVYVAIASMMKDHPNDYCFATYLQDHHPHIKADDLWNPFINHPVKNDIAMGHEHPSIIVLSGPNTGGKSTITNAITYSILLSQTLGIAAATSFTVTPFSKIIAHRNISDDPTVGESGFKAEVNNVKTITKTIESKQQPGEFVFVTLDELFRSTSADQGDTLSYKTVQHLAKQEHVLGILATHFSSPLHVEAENSRCKNYRMSVRVDDQGNVTQYTYLFEPGISTIKNALQISKEENPDIFS